MPDTGRKENIRYLFVVFRRLFESKVERKALFRPVNLKPHERNIAFRPVFWESPRSGGPAAEGTAKPLRGKRFRETESFGLFSLCFTSTGWAPFDIDEAPLWLGNGIAKLESLASYTWSTFTRGQQTGNMAPKDMEPETRAIWDQYREGHIDDEAVRTQLKIAQPILVARRKAR